MAEKYGMIQMMSFIVSFERCPGREVEKSSVQFYLLGNWLTQPSAPLCPSWVALQTKRGVESREKRRRSERPDQEDKGELYWDAGQGLH